MKTKYAKLAATPVPQTEPLNERQVKNNAGGFVFVLDDWKRLDRFLILGSDAPTYYQKAPALTRENARCVTRCWETDAARTAARIVEISQAGRAPKNDSAIFALALGVASQHPEVRAVAYGSVGMICRTATHLFQFVQNVKALGKGISSPGMKRVLKGWYTGRSVDAMAYQMIKYREREGFNHARALNICGYGAKTQPGSSLRALLQWAKTGVVGSELPRLVKGHLDAMALQDNPKAVAKLIKEYKLPFEAVPKEVQGKPEVWAAVLPDLGATALIRNLGRMTNYGVLKPLSDETQFVVGKLTDVEFLRKGRIHPFNVLVAASIYDQGQSERGGRGGGMTWTPVPAISAALEQAFYASFKTVEPSGKRTLIALDVSGSMTWTTLMGSKVTPRDAAAVMSMLTMRNEPNWHVVAFAGGIQEVKLKPSMSLGDVIGTVDRLYATSTDCSLPMLYAAANNLKVDVFQIYTDNETWAGSVHPVKALQQYRQKTGIPAKLAVVGMTSTGFSIADPEDAGMLDVVGFDSAAPAAMAEFARG